MEYLTLDILQKPIIQISFSTSSVLLDLADNEQAIINKLIYSGLFEKEQYLNEHINYTHTLKPGNKYYSTTCIESNNKVMLIKYISVDLISLISKTDLLDGYKAMNDVIEDTKDISMLLVSKKEKQIHLWKLEFGKTNIINVTDHSVYCFV